MFALIMALTLLHRIPTGNHCLLPTGPKNAVERISQTVTFTKQQKEDVIAIYTKFYDDVRAQQAFRDPSKMDPLEKARDAKVEKLLKNPKLYKQYQDA